LLPFIRRRFPNDRIVAYSDAGGARAQLEVARLSPYIDETVAIRTKPGAIDYKTMGHLANLCDEDLQKLRSADRFFDAWGAGLFLDAACSLGVPFYEVLASRSELRIPDSADAAARTRLKQFAGQSVVAMNLTKWGSAILQSDRLRQFVTSLLQNNPRVNLLNIYQTKFDYAHWPEPFATQRRILMSQDLEVCSRVDSWHPRIVPLTDLPLAVVAAILRNSSYFLGVDNGIKHMAWALNVPLTLFSPDPPSISQILRWIPDTHRLLVAACNDAQLQAHLDDAQNAIAANG
jgi:hypothetical protein